MGKMLKTAKITVSAIFCVVSAGMAFPCFAEEPLSIIGWQNQEYANAAANGFQAITEAYNENYFGRGDIAALAAENYNGLNTNTPTLAIAYATGSSPRVAVKSPAQSISPASAQQSRNALSVPTAESNNNLIKITSAAPDARITGTESLKTKAVRDPKIHIATQQEQSRNSCLDEKKTVLKNTASEQIQENAAREQKYNSEKSLKQQEFSNCGRKPAKESPAITFKDRNKQSENIGADQAQSVMPYQRPLFTDKPCFKNKSQINSVRKSTKYNAEAMYNAVCGIMPYLKNGLINQSKILAAQEDADPLLPPVNDPVNNEPANVPEKSEAYKKFNFNTTGYDGIDIYPANNKNINQITEEIICSDIKLKQSVNYSKTGLSPPDSTDISNSLLLSRQSLPLFGLSSHLNQTGSQSSNNRIIDPPMRLREGFSFIGNVLSEASFFDCPLADSYLNSHCKYVSDRAVCFSTMRAISHPPEVWPS